MRVCDCIILSESVNVCILYMSVSFVVCLYSCALFMFMVEPLPSALCSALVKTFPWKPYQHYDV